MAANNKSLRMGHLVRVVQIVDCTGHAESDARNLRFVGKSGKIVRIITGVDADGVYRPRTGETPESPLLEVRFKNTRFQFWPEELRRIKK
jgi:hypothetical protein